MAAICGTYGPAVLAVDLSKPVDELLVSLPLLDGEGREAETLILVHDGSRPAVVAAARLRVLAPPGTVLLLPVHLPPMARACVALAVAELAEQRLVPGLVAGVARDVVGLLSVWARLVSVARLRRPEATMAQHLRSYVPGSSFLAVVQPRPRVSTWSPAAVQQLPAAPGDSLIVTCSVRADGGADQFQAGQKARTVLCVPPAPSSSEWWGSRAVAEAVTVPVGASLDRLVNMALHDAFTCRWCRRLMRGDTCPACQMLHTADLARAS